MIEQLSFLEETLEEKVEKKIRFIEDKFEKVRKSLYAKNSEIAKRCEALENENEILKSALCRCGLKIGISETNLSFFVLNQKQE